MSEWKEMELGDVLETNRSSIDRDYQYSEVLYLDTSSITRNLISGLGKISMDAKTFPIIGSNQKMKMAKQKNIHIQGLKKGYRSIDNDDFISITDIAKLKEEAELNKRIRENLSKIQMPDA